MDPPLTKHSLLSFDQGEYYWKSILPFGQILFFFFFFGHQKKRMGSSEKSCCDTLSLLLSMEEQMRKDGAFTIVKGFESLFSTKKKTMGKEEN